MPLTATPLYAGLAALLFLYLSVRVIGTRQAEKVSVGDGANKAMIKAMRTQSNCAEYAPISLLLLMLVELQGAPIWAVHVLGLMFLSGRVLHAIGFGRTPQIIPLRKSGMLLTFAMLALSALGLVAHGLI